MVLDITPRPIMLVAGESAHSLYNSQDVYEAASNPKELLIVPDAEHVDLHDNPEKIPFDKLEAFFKANLQSIYRLCRRHMVATGHILYQGKEFLVQHAHFLIEVQYSAERAWTLCIGSTYALPYK